MIVSSTSVLAEPVGPTRQIAKIGDSRGNELGGVSISAFAMATVIQVHLFHPITNTMVKLSAKLLQTKICTAKRFR